MTIVSRTDGEQIAKLSVVVTRGLLSREPREVESALRVLNQHLEIDGPKRLHRASAAPALTEFIELIGSAAALVPLAAAAGVYLSTLARHAGDATWEGLRKLFKSKEVKPLADVSNALASIANQSEAEVEIVVAVNVPDEYWGTRVIIQGGDPPEEIARKMAAFIVRAEALTKMMRAEVDAGRTPLAGAKVEVEEDGSLLVTWLSSEDRKTHERRVS